jgi:hypothetical protein
VFFIRGPAFVFYGIGSCHAQFVVLFLWQPGLSWPSRSAAGHHSQLPLNKHLIKIFRNKKIHNKNEVHSQPQKKDCMRKYLLSASLLFMAYASQAQLNYLPGLTQNGTTTYTAIGTNGTAISVANNDDANSTAQPIGFTFSYNGQTFTDFIFNTNGFIKLGSTAPTSAAIFGTSQDATGGIMLMSAGNYPANGNCISVFNHDLQGTGTTEYRVYTSGTAPNRVCTIEWKAVQEKTASPQLTSMDFQIKLYETTNTIDFVYANFTPSANADAFKTAGVGLVGTNITGSNVLYVRKGSTTAWSGAFFENAGNVTTQIFNFRRTVNADNGRTYRFFQALNDDVTMNAVYTLGKAGRGVGNSVRASITNNGMSTKTNYVLTLNITGANTFTTTTTIPSLASGATTTVSFPYYTPINLGTDNVSVSAPADDDPADNTASTTSEVTTNDLSYATGTTATGGVNAGSGGIIAAKFSVPYANIVSQISFYIGTAALSYDAFIYDATGTGGAPGATLWSSTGLTTTSGLNTIAVPNQAVSGSFYVGIKQNGASLPVQYQTESPLRPGTFYLLSGANPWFDLSGNASNIYKVMFGVATANVLPVTITDFNGERRSSGNLLTWSTSTEINNRGFELERSADGSKFSSIAFIATKAEGGNSASALNYSFVDNKPLTATNYYRLKQIDNDGRATYSPIVTLKGEKVDFVISALYPNPVKDRLTLSLVSSTNEKITVTITDLAGKTVKQVNTSVIAGDNNLDLNVGSLAAGSYYIKVISGSVTKTTQFIKN